MLRSVIGEMVRKRKMSSRIAAAGHASFPAHVTHYERSSFVQIAPVPEIVADFHFGLVRNEMVTLVVACAFDSQVSRFSLGIIRCLLGVLRLVFVERIDVGIIAFFAFGLGENIVFLH